MKKLLLLFILFPHILASQIPLGSWVDHLSYNNANSVAFDGTQVYCGTKSGLFSFNINDNSISRYSTINMLSDVATQSVAINPYNKVLCIFYIDGNIDLIRNGKTINIPHVKNSNAILNTQINHIGFHKEYVFVSYDFGLIKINTDKNEISETYSFSNISTGLEVRASGVLKNKIYVATSNGLYVGHLTSNLLDFNNWELVAGIPLDDYKEVLVFQDSIYALNKDNNLFRKENNNWKKIPIDLNALNFIKNLGNELAVAFDKRIVIYNSQLDSISVLTGNFENSVDLVEINLKHYFIAIRNSGMSEYRNNFYVKTIKPNGPSSSDAFDMAASNNNLWVVRGGIKGYWDNTNKYGELHYFDGAKWINWNPWSHPLYLKAIDLIDIEPDPNDEDKVFISSWGGGLLELEDNIPKILYDESNSSIVSRSEHNAYHIGGTEFDKEGNLWLSNSYNTIALSVKKTDDSWKSFEFSQHLEYTSTTGDVVISNAGHKWILMPRNNRILVFDDNNTIDDPSDDRSILLNTNANNGNIPGSTGITVEFDQNGDGWAGSNAGIFVFYNADNIFENYTTGAQRIIIDGGENFEILLETISVTEIKIDGANRKWIATDGSGVYLISEDGKEEIHHFTKENSPLFSNVVSSLAIDHKTGMVYFGTDKGIIAYRSDATAGKENFSEINIFPNPVRADYSGPIIISGLMENSKIKITDISGKLINEITSFGGQAVWNGKDFQGKRASTGVYLLFSSAMDQDNRLQTEIGKILFVH